MEFTSRQLSALNTILPQYYKMDPMDTRKSRRPDTTSTSTSLPQKRPPPVPQQASLGHKLTPIIHNLKKHPASGPFLSSLLAIERNILANKYESVDQFTPDLQEVWHTRTAESTSDTPNLALELSQYAEKLIAELKGAPITENKAKPKQEKPMSLIEKKTLRENINKLSPENLKGLYQIVKSHSSMNSGQLTFDIDSLPPKVCREIDAFVKQTLQKTQAIPKKQTEEPSLPQGTPESSDDSSSSEDEVEDAPVVNEQKQENEVSSLYDQFKQTQKETDLLGEYGSMMDFNKPI